MKNDMFMTMTFENVFKNHKKTPAFKESLGAYFTIFNKNKAGILALHSFYEKEIKDSPDYSPSIKGVVRTKLKENFIKSWLTNSLVKSDIAVIEQYFSDYTASQQRNLAAKIKKDLKRDIFDSQPKKLDNPLTLALNSYKQKNTSLLAKFIKDTEDICDTDRQRIFKNIENNYIPNKSIDILIQLLNKKDPKTKEFNGAIANNYKGGVFFALNLLSESSDKYAEFYEASNNTFFKPTKDKGLLELLNYRQMSLFEHLSIFNVHDNKKNIADTFSECIIYFFHDDSKKTPEQKINLIHNIDYIFKSVPNFSDTIKKKIKSTISEPLTLEQILNNTFEIIKKQDNYDINEFNSIIKEIKNIYFHDKLNNDLSDNKSPSKTFKL